MKFLTLHRRLLWGSLDLTAAPFLIPFEAMDLTAGDLVTNVLSSFLQDGDLEVTSRRGNMTLKIPVMVEGSDLGDLADAEALLADEAQRPTNTLTIDPGDGIGAVTVFDTFEGDVAFEFSDTREQNAVRSFTITLRALPFGRSVAEVVTPALPASGTTTVVVDSGSSTTGWSATPTAPTSSGGFIRATRAAGNTSPIVATRTGSVDTSVTKYIVVDWVAELLTSNGSYQPVKNTAFDLLVDGTLAAQLSQVASPTAGLTRSTFMVTGASATTLAFRAPIALLDPTIAARLSIDSVSRTDIRPSLGSARQQVRSVAVAGSAPTQGSLQVSSPTSSLGDVMVYTYPDTASGYVPTLRPFSVQTTTADATTASGVRSPFFGGAFSADVPARLLTPGLYALVVRVKSASSSAYTGGSITWSASSRVNGAQVGRTLSGVTPFTLPSGGAYSFVAVANLNLPVTGMRDNTTGITQITAIDTKSGADTVLDDAYLLNLSTGRLTIVSCGTGTAAAGGSSNRLWLDAATVQTRTAVVMKGFSADGTDAQFAGDSIAAASQHEFRPASVNVFTVTSNATDSVVALSHFPRWLGHAAS